MGCGHCFASIMAYCFCNSFMQVLELLVLYVGSSWFISRWFGYKFLYLFLCFNFLNGDLDVSVGSHISISLFLLVMWINDQSETTMIVTDWFFLVSFSTSLTSSFSTDVLSASVESLSMRTALYLLLDADLSVFSAADFCKFIRNLLFSWIKATDTIHLSRWTVSWILESEVSRQLSSELQRIWSQVG